MILFSFFCGGSERGSEGARRKKTITGRNKQNNNNNNNNNENNSRARKIQARALHWLEEYEHKGWEN